MAGPSWDPVRAHTVVRVLRAVAAHRDRERLFTAIADALRDVLPFDMLVVLLDGPGPDEMTPYFLHPRRSVPVQRSIAALVTRLGMSSFLAVPLAIRGSVFATLVLMTERERGFEGVDRPYACVLAAAIAIAVDHCLTYELIERSRAQIDRDNLLLREELHAARDRNDLVADSAAMQEVVRLCDRVAPTDATVLVVGDTGTGKERVALRIHARSARADRPLVSLNCAAIPQELIESELFGHEAGAFTGATRRRRGRFELADRGTLFLDEIGEMPLEAQARLLRVLQHRTVERVGGNEVIPVDVRIIAATNRDLRELVAAGTFRADLYYRLAVFPIEMPSLWERREDIPALARELVADSARRLGRTPPHLDAATLAALQSYAWPGNVRELQNVLERAVILSGGGGMLDVAPLLGVAEPAAALVADDRATTELRRLLDEAGWVIEGPSGVAMRLGVHPSTLRSRMRRLGIERPR